MLWSCALLMPANLQRSFRFHVQTLDLHICQEWEAHPPGEWCSSSVEDF